MLKDRQDAYGHGVHDYLSGIQGVEIVERDDGYLHPSGGPKLYFAPYEEWFPVEKKAIKYARGRVLDIGCGAGRQALYLQDEGHEVVGIDTSPLAIDVCRRRGVKDARIMSITRIGPALGTFDTAIMFGGNFGLFGTPQRAKRLLKRLHRIASTQGRIIAVSTDVYATDGPVHLAYHAANRAKGKLSGQMRLKVRYERYSSSWFDWLIVSREEMEGIMEGTGWNVAKYLDAGTPLYAAVIEKQ